MFSNPIGGTRISTSQVFLMEIILKSIVIIKFVIFFRLILMQMNRIVQIYTN